MMQTIDPFPGHYDASDPFGNAAPPRQYGHTGSDWGNGLGGELIPAITAGTVVFAGWEPTGGNGYCVCVDMGNGLYWAGLHQAQEPFVSVGEHVALGEHVGVVGGTGSNARGPHLHITISDSPRAYQGAGNKIDPWQFIQDHLTATAGDGSSPIQQVIKKMEAHMPVAIYEANKPGGSPWILVFPGGEYAVSGAEGQEVDGVGAADRNTGAVIERVWGPAIGLNGTDVRTVLALNQRMTAQAKANLRA
jgi:murein DD-endopeptidase MepM/ murein hydrolase activator NlpD